MTVTAYAQPSDVFAEGGNVIVEGPDGVAVTLTVDAAEETARRLAMAAEEARRQDAHTPDAGLEQGEVKLG